MANYCILKFVCSCTSPGLTSDMKCTKCGKDCYEIRDISPWEIYSQNTKWGNNTEKDWDEVRKYYSDILYEIVKTNGKSVETRCLPEISKLLVHLTNIDNFCIDLGDLEFAQRLPKVLNKIKKEYAEKNTKTPNQKPIQTTEKKQLGRYYINNPRKNDLGYPTSFSDCCNSFAKSFFFDEKSICINNVFLSLLESVYSLDHLLIDPKSIKKDCIAIFENLRDKIASFGSEFLLDSRNMPLTHEAEIKYQPVTDKSLNHKVLKCEVAGINFSHNILPSIKEKCVVYLFDSSNEDTFTLTLHPNGGSGQTTNVEVLCEDYDLPLDLFEPPQGYILKGWAYTPNGPIIENNKIIITGNTELYAIYADNRYVINTKANCINGPMDFEETFRLISNIEQTILFKAFKDRIPKDPNRHFKHLERNMPTIEIDYLAYCSVMFDPELLIITSSGKKITPGVPLEYGSPIRIKLSKLPKAMDLSIELKTSISIVYSRGDNCFDLTIERVADNDSEYYDHFTPLSAMPIIKQNSNADFYYTLQKTVEKDNLLKYHFSSPTIFKVGKEPYKTTMDDNAIDEILREIPPVTLIESVYVNAFRGWDKCEDKDTGILYYTAKQKKVRLEYALYEYVKNGYCKKISEFYGMIKNLQTQDYLNDKIKNYFTNGLDDSVVHNNITIFENGIYFVENSTAKYLCSISDEKTVSIPAQILLDGAPLKVIAVSEYALADSKNLTEVILPKSIQQIGAGAFKDCPMLTKITLPPSLKTIPERLFYNSGIQKIELPKDLMFIGKESFCKDKLNEIELPDSVSIIDDGAFSNCKNLSKVIFGSTPITLANRVFKNCSSLVDLEKSEKIIEIGEECFDSCSNLETLNMNGLKVIMNRAFAHCGKLTTVEFSESLEKVGSEIFFKCKQSMLRTLIFKSNPEFSIDSFKGLINSDNHPVTIKIPRIPPNADDLIPKNQYEIE